MSAFIITLVAKIAKLVHAIKNRLKIIKTKTLLVLLTITKLK